MPILGGLGTFNTILSPETQSIFEGGVEFPIVVGGSDCGLVMYWSFGLPLDVEVGDDCGSGGNERRGLDKLLGLLTSMFKEPFLYSTFSRIAASSSKQASASPTEVSGLLSRCGAKR